MLVFLLPGCRMLRVPVAGFFTTLPLPYSESLCLDFSCFAPLWVCRPSFRGRSLSSATSHVGSHRLLSRAVGVGRGIFFVLFVFVFVLRSAHVLFQPPFADYLGKEAKNFLSKTLGSRLLVG